MAQVQGMPTQSPRCFGANYEKATLNFLERMQQRKEERSLAIDANQKMGKPVSSQLRVHFIRRTGIVSPIEKRGPQPVDSGPPQNLLMNPGMTPVNKWIPTPKPKRPPVFRTGA